MLDCAIIGTGPAGLSTALTLKARNKSFVWFGTKDLSLKVSKAEKIKNYPGLINVSGKEMQSVFLKQIEDADIKIEEKIVTGVYAMGDYYSILCNQDMYEAKTIVVCTGVSSVGAIKGEEENLGNGVSYCATCDGFLYKDKEIAVVVQDPSYMEEVEYLKDIASKLYLIPLYKGAAIEHEKIELIEKRPKAIEKKEGISLVFEDSTLDVACVFFLKNAVAPQVLIPGISTMDGHIVVDRDCQTNLAGCFAAGDVTGKPYQYTKAVGEGNIAAHSVVRYLATIKE